MNYRVARPRYMKDKGISWVIDLLVEEHAKKRRSVKGGSFKRVPVDEVILVCPSCEIAWENVWSDGIRRTIHYKNFPTLGKERKVCLKCRKKKKNTSETTQDLKR